MIPIDKKITELTWGEIVADLDERYRKGTIAPVKQLYHNSVAQGFLNVKECAALTGYAEDYVRQLVFKRAIPFHKNPKLKPIRFKRAEILEWMATKKFAPIGEMAEEYISENSVTRESTEGKLGDNVRNEIKNMSRKARIIQ